MSSQVAAERQKATLTRNGGSSRRKPTHVACISKNLFDTPPQSAYFPLQIFFNFCHAFLANLSKFVYGQFLITFFDFYMIKLEKTLDFCVPQDMSVSDIAENHRNSLTPHDRPMTWIFFIPALIMLRMFRFWLSVFCIILGKGEITAKQMQMKIVSFRRYYRSVRHYAVTKLTESELKLKEERCTGSFIWRVIYNIDGRIFMRKPPVEIHSNMPKVHRSSEEQTDNSVKHRNGGSVKNSLNEIDGDSSGSDDEMTTEQLLDEYAKIEDSSADPDWVPGDSEPSSEEISSEGEIDTEEEKTESQKKLNGNDAANTSANLSGNGSFNGYSSDNENREKSKIQLSTTLDEQQMAELENQLVVKIMKHFKSTFNFSPTTTVLDDVFYSPIGSPPEKGYNSDSEINSNTNADEPINNKLSPSAIKIMTVNQIQEISSSQEKSSGEEVTKQL